VQSALTRCNLLEKQKVLIRKLSKGFRQRVGIAQAIVHDPPAIILDEPTVGLDPRQIIDVRNLIKSLAGRHTIILSTHILPEASMTCSRIAIINRGEIVATNTPDGLMRQLAEGAGYELEVEGDIESAQQQLQNLSGVQRVESIADSYLSENRHKLRLTLEPGSDLGRDIAAIVIGSGLGLYEMRRVQASLEDVFLQLTTEEKVSDEAQDLENSLVSPNSAPQPESEPESEPESASIPPEPSQPSGGEAA
jgi:ABC-2 type transport system ATP-binding protein